MKGRFFCFTFFIFYLFQSQARAQEPAGVNHHAFYLNSYSMGYTWADSVTAGVLEILSKRSDLSVFYEFLDAKRFGNTATPNIYELYKNRFRNIPFDVVVTSDNDALDFMMKYGDTLFPGVPVVFCGINDPEDYHFENRKYYGILDGIDLKDEIDMIAKVCPEIKTLYFISDSATTTSLINIRYVKRIEPQYQGRFRFSYICRLDPDSLIRKVKKFEKGSAIALINYYQDLQGNPVNPERINLQVTQNAAVPVFMESETLLGKGIAGGIFIKGRIHGHEVARLALQFVDNKDYQPPQKIYRPVNRYYFDHAVLKKFGISDKNLPEGSIVINKQNAVFLQLLKYLIPLVAIIAFLLVVVMVLLFNIRKRRKAEAVLAEAHHQVKEMNTELEEINEHLSFTNEELRRAKLKSEESDRLKSSFLANMSHEIRTPLNAIIGFSSLLNDSHLKPEDRDTYFKIINSNSNQLLHIIEDILDLSRIEAGQLKVFIDVFSLNEVLSEITDSFSKAKTNADVDVVMSTCQANVMLRTDSARFKQILGNLISNALKFTKKGQVEIGFDIISDNNITFFVKDTGIGIDEKNLERIFNRFWKSDGENENFQSGAGLGLSICKSLAQALGGKIWAESKPDAGSTFYLSLPDFEILSAETKDVSENISNNVTYNWKNLTFAIAEDEISNQYLLTRILRNYNANSICFRNGKEISQYISDNSDQKIDLILMDLKMPVMDGYTAFKIIREINHEIPVIAQSAYAMIEDIDKIKAAGFSDFIVKPIRPEQLVEKIRKVLKI